MAIGEDEFFTGTTTTVIASLMAGGSIFFGPRKEDGSPRQEARDDGIRRKFLMIVLHTSARFDPHALA